MPRRDPYETLGVQRGVSDEELHAAYRRLVKLHHPDHNAGSPDAARRFEEVQDAYAEVRRIRPHRPSSAGRAGAGPAVDPAVEAKLAEIEHQLLEAARVARERARQAARDAAAAAAGRPADGTGDQGASEDSLSRILADARAELADRFAEVRGFPIAERLADLIDELSSRLPRDRAGGSAD